MEQSPCPTGATSFLGSRQECIVFCVREEPVLFLRAEEDFVPYTPRDKRNLHENLQGLGPGVQAESLELAIRKEVRAAGVGGASPARPWAAEMTPDHSSALLSLARPCPSSCPAWASGWLQGRLTGSQRKDLFPALFALPLSHTQHPY